MWKVGAALNDNSRDGQKVGYFHYVHGTLNMKKSSFFRTKTLMEAHIALGENVNINRQHKKSVQEQHIQGQYKC